MQIWQEVRRFRFLDGMHAQSGPSFFASKIIYIFGLITAIILYMLGLITPYVATLFIHVRILCFQAILSPVFVQKNLIFLDFSITKSVSFSKRCPGRSIQNLLAWVAKGIPNKHDLIMKDSIVMLQL